MRRREVNWARWGVYILILVIGLINLISQTNFGDRPDLQTYGDATYYLEMSRQTLASVPSPYVFRILSPLIVHEARKLPGIGLNSAWLLLTIVATNIAVIIFFKILYDHFKLSFFISTVFSLVLACTYNYTLFNYRDIWLVDPLNNLFIMLALYFLFRPRLWAFAAVIAVGSINKETMLLLAPLYPALAWVRGAQLTSPKVVKSLALMSVVGAAYLVFRWQVLREFGPGAHKFLVGPGGTGILHNIRFSLSSGINVEQAAIFNVFHFMWLIFGFGLYRLVRKRGWRSEVPIVATYLLAVSLLGRLFATDTGRIYVLAAPMVLAVAAMTMDEFRSETGRLWVCVLAFLYLTLNFQWLTGAAGIFTDLLAVILFVALVGMSRFDWTHLLDTTQPRL